MDAGNFSLKLMPVSSARIKRLLVTLKTNGFAETKDTMQKAVLQ
jgi:hypothetical protein